MPPLDSDTGNLPPGVHTASWAEIEAAFGSSPWRRQLLDGLHAALIALQVAGCRRAYIDGSFVTSNDVPGDFDGCWEAAGVDYDALDPVLLQMRHPAPSKSRNTGVSYSSRIYRRYRKEPSFSTSFRSTRTPVKRKASSPST